MLFNTYDWKQNKRADTVEELKEIDKNEKAAVRMQNYFNFIAKSYYRYNGSFLSFRLLHDRIAILTEAFSMFQKEYHRVQQTRETLLNYCQKLNDEEFSQSNGFGFQSVRDTFIHISDCYYAWLGSFILSKTVTPITPKGKCNQFTLEMIQARFNEVDHFVEEVFTQYGNNLDVTIEKPIPWRKTKESISMSVSKLLMHSITHEFHHKGQIVAMIRQMGYEPPNTDILRTRD
ncbi:hypothetical protein BTS2_3890 [Bacillus sp. TS-2]|nr:hypothetical protein BTS2_3890 [Bacillus sp. TS-2]